MGTGRSEKSLEQYAEITTRKEKETEIECFKRIKVPMDKIREFLGIDQKVENVYHSSYSDTLTFTVKADCKDES